MSEDKLRTLASASIYFLVAASKICTPISSLDLLTSIISHGTPAGLFDALTPAPCFRLTDLSRFELILDSFAWQWDRGQMAVSHDDDGLTVMDIQLGSGSNDALSGLNSGGRKRKRVKDEDADSAAGSGDDAEDVYEVKKPISALGGLSKQFKEVYSILQKSTAKGRLLAEQVCLLQISIPVFITTCIQFRSVNASFEPICAHITKDDCVKSRAAGSNPLPSICDRVHFRPLLRPHTDTALGHCSYLNTCYSEPTYAQSPSIPPLPSAQNQLNAQWPKPQLPSGLGAGGRGKEKAPCRYLHYEVDFDPGDAGQEERREDRRLKKSCRLEIGQGPMGKEMSVVNTNFFPPPEWNTSSYLNIQLPPQWVNCDLRRFDYSVLGKFHVIMADPPWDIHMSVRCIIYLNTSFHKHLVPSCRTEL